MKRELICIVCPQGCAMTARIQGQSVTVTGHTCPRGEEYAVSECLHPMRTVTSTVRISNRPDTLLSVKTEAPVPREHMMDVIAQLRAVTVTAPVSIGQEILSDCFGTRIIATKNIE